MIGNLIFFYLLYIVLTSWIFWVIAGVIFTLIGFAISPLFRTAITLAFVMCLVFLWKNN